MTSCFRSAKNWTRLTRSTRPPTRKNWTKHSGPLPELQGLLQLGAQGSKCNAFHCVREIMLWIQGSPTELGETRTINPDLCCLGSHAHAGPIHSPPHSATYLPVRMEKPKFSSFICSTTKKTLISTNSLFYWTIKCSPHKGAVDTSMIWSPAPPSLQS